MPMLRLFIAIALPAEVKGWLTELQRDLRGMGFAARWVRPEGMHLTLKFLGDIAVPQVEAIRHALADAAGQIAFFALYARGLGVFAGVRNARVLWSGLAGDRSSLLALHREIETRLLPLGFAPERRPFHGHLTLGRVTGLLDSRRVVGAMEKFASECSPGFEASAVSLLKSERLPGGSHYTTLQTCILTGEPAA